MAQRRSLSGRSPFCHRKRSEESQIHWKPFSLNATITKPKTKKHQPRCSLPESAGGYRCSLFLGQLDQGLVGYAESTHVNRPKGKACLLHGLEDAAYFEKSNNNNWICDKYAQPVGLGEKWPGAYVVVSYIELPVIFFFRRCRVRLKLRRSFLLFRLSIPTYENISETDT